ncbi:MAG: hypothetical protein PHW13_08720 [Methylococcales bacterium]|nr:hypothetical protein [Methylococcales bacterium]
MKRKLLSAAISAIALAGVSQSSQATTSSYDVYLAGSSAQDSLVMQEAYNLCVAGTFTYYMDNSYAALGATNTSSWGSNYKVYSCTLNSSIVTTVPGNPTVYFHKVNYGGSAQGVAPLFQNAAVPTLNINNSNCYSLAGYSAKVGNSSITVPTYGCTTTNTNDLISANLDAGLSDVNPTMFQGVNRTTTYDQSGNPITTFADVKSIPAGFTVVPATSLIWAVPVSLNLYTALQAAQGLLNYSGGTYGTGSCSAGQYSIDPTSARDGLCMPTLNKSQISSVLTGALSDWSLFNFNGVNLVTAANDYDAHRPSGATTIAPSVGTTVYFCQRTPGSGTAASQYAYFLNQPANNTDASVIPANNLGNEYVFSIADGGNMENCLIDFATGSTKAADYTGKPVNIAGQTAWAIGQQSSDKNASASKQYRFIKINGALPNLAAAFSGDYAFVNESTWQYPTTAATGRGTQQLIAKALISRATDPASLYTDLNQFSVQQFGPAGFMGTLSNALAQNGSYTLPTSVSTTYPVTPWTHTNLNGVLDNGMFPIIDLSATVAP